MAKIMIVDDSKFSRKMLGDILVEEGHQIVGEAENAEEAVELYRRLEPDLVTLDIIMPGVEQSSVTPVLEALMAVDSHAKVVMVSAMGQQEVVEECIQAGAMDFIVKPLQPSNVVGVVEDVLKGEQC